mgnify:CR=1 FL=1
MTINIKIPAERQADWIGFIAELQDVNVDVGLPARVVINERTGTIVVGGDVAVRPVQVAHGKTDGDRMESRLKSLTIDGAAITPTGEPCPAPEPSAASD